MVLNNNGIKININGYCEEDLSKLEPITVIANRDEMGFPIIMTMEIGTGDNLLDEDYEEGYVDYANVYSYEYEDSDEGFTMLDGGMVLTKTLIEDMEHGLIDIIPNALYEMGIVANDVVVV